MSSPEHRPSIDEVLRHYAVGPVLATQSLGGTAGAAARVRTAAGLFVLRRRGERTSAVEHVAFDAAFRRYLRERGVPAVPPIPTVDGEDGVLSPDGFWELTEFIDGLAFRPGDPTQVRGLARTLAALHRVGTTFRGQRTEDRLLRQFDLAAPGVPRSSRIDDPGSLGAGLEAVGLELDARERAIVDRMRMLVERISASYSGAAYDALDRCVIHGDLHPDNLLFDQRGEVRALFDFDWSARAPRVRDLADAVWFFAGAPERPGADIWALTAARGLSPDLSALLLRTYHAIEPIDPAEARALPWAWLARWIAIHLEGIYKVPPADRGRFLTRDMGETVEEMLALDAVQLLGAGIS